MNIALIVFAGSGVRMNNPTPKQFIKINGKEVVSFAINTFNKCSLIDEIVLVTHKDYLDFVSNMVKRDGFNKVVKIVPGGKSRQESVKLGLLSKEYDENDNVLIHDGDRPLIKEELIGECISKLDSFVAVTPYIERKDALEEISNLGRSKEVNGSMFDIQTPQCFKYGIIKKYHIQYSNVEVSDDISLVERDYEVCYLPGDKYNFKITTEADMECFKKIVSKYYEKSN